MVETETETRIWTIFETETTRDRQLDVKTESLADLWLTAILKPNHYEEKRVQEDMDIEFVT